MASPLSRHTRLVFWLKIILPLVALAILSSLFLFARRIDFEGTLPYAEVDIEALANDPRLTSPEFVGMTTDGVDVRVAAAEARPGATPEAPLTARSLMAVFERPDGSVITAQSATGVIDQAGSQLTLEGDAVVATSSGFDLRSRIMLAALDRTDVRADEDVLAQTPLGTVESGGMRLSGLPGQEVLVFTGGVRLLYIPEN